MLGKLLKLISHKACITVFSLLFQIALIIFAVVYAAAYFQWIMLVCELISVAICLYIISRDINPDYKLSWCVLILIIPAFGGLLYIFIGRQHTPRRTQKLLYAAADASQVLLNRINADIMQKRGALNPTDCATADLVLNASSYPMYSNTRTKYYALGEDFFSDLIADITRAQKYIFMEYFIIETGAVWSEIQSALIERALSGVEIKIIYDDVGSMFTMPKKTLGALRSAGIQVLPFNKITLSFDMRLNNRSHRKITVIDGEIAYTGGNNIADEYANKRLKYGQWKDAHMRFEGDAVRSFCAMFLSFWHVLSAQSIAFDDYLGKSETTAHGYVQPLSSGPGRNNMLIQRAFINMISTAKRYVYITTPYLILDSDVLTALVNAALSGVDVRIIIPARPDKKTVYLTTRSFVPPLIKAGVRVYTYTPGFIHAKMLITDDERAFIGTCNMDYRSFYLHYECGAILYNTDTIPEMRNDFLASQKLSREIPRRDADKFRPLTRLGQAILRLLAPLM